MRISEVSVGAAVVIGERRGRPWRTAIEKRSVGAARVGVGALGLEGDVQHNRKYHGGPHQAVYAYATEDAAWWSHELGRTVDASVLGQNLTTEGIDVNAVVIGERWRVGTTLLEATGPRIPCATLAKRIGVPGMVERFARAGRCGAYFRVLEPGSVGTGDPIAAIDRPRARPDGRRRHGDPPRRARARGRTARPTRAQPGRDGLGREADRHRSRSGRRRGPTRLCGSRPGCAVLSRVPRVSSFYGIAIFMYWNEGHHTRPHFHARYAGEAASSTSMARSSPAACRHARWFSWAIGHGCIRTSCRPTGNGLVVRRRWRPSIRCRSLYSVEPLLDVTAVEVIGPYRLRLSFDDGTIGEVDFSDRAWRGIFEPLSDPAYFGKVAIDPDGGTICWPNGVDMAPEPLYEAARLGPLPTTA